MKLEGKVALITGAAAGIGRAAAVLFAREGAKVVVADIKEAEGKETVSLVEQAGGDALPMQIDLTRVTDIERMVKAAVSHYGKLDIFYHNAGLAGPGVLELTTESAYDLAMTVNLKAGFFGAKYAAPEIKRAGGGCILFTASGLGLRPSPQSPVYSISKAGLVMLTRALAVALAKDNIRVNVICPGPVDTTQLWRDVQLRNQDVDSKLYAQAGPTRPIKRSGTVEEMANAALFLVSPEASYITGVALPIDGGGAAM